MGEEKFHEGHAGFSSILQEKNFSKYEKEISTGSKEQH